jgi:hypothetical protein
LKENQPMPTLASTATTTTAVNDDPRNRITPSQVEAVLRRIEQIPAIIAEFREARAKNLGEEREEKLIEKCDSARGYIQGAVYRLTGYGQTSRDICNARMDYVEAEAVIRGRRISVTHPATDATGLDLTTDEGKAAFIKADRKIEEAGRDPFGMLLTVDGKVIPYL